MHQYIIELLFLEIRSKLTKSRVILPKITNASYLEPQNTNYIFFLNFLKPSKDANYLEQR